MKYILSLLLLAGCCTQQSGSMSKYHEDGRKKPQVVLAPITATVVGDLPWSVTTEFENLIRSKIEQFESIYVTKEKRKPISGDPFDTDIDWIKEDYEGCEFVAFLQLVQHEVTADENNDASINIAFMLRIVDVRSKPKIILQQLVKCSHPSVTRPDYYTINWEDNNYRFTPMAFAHRKIAKKIIQQIADYVTISQSHG